MNLLSRLFISPFRKTGTHGVVHVTATDESILNDAAKFLGVPVTVKGKPNRLSLRPNQVRSLESKFKGHTVQREEDCFE